MKLLVKHVHWKNTKSDPEDFKGPHYSESPDSKLESSSDLELLSLADEIIEVKLSNMNYATYFPVKISNNNTIYMFDTETTIYIYMLLTNYNPNQH